MSILTKVNINGVEVTLFQLLQWKHAMRLESKGIKIVRGRSVVAHVKRVLGLKGNNQKVIAEFERIMAQVESQLQAIKEGLARNETPKAHVTVTGNTQQRNTKGE